MGCRWSPTSGLSVWPGIPHDRVAGIPRGVSWERDGRGASLADGCPFPGIAMEVPWHHFYRIPLVQAVARSCRFPGKKHRPASWDEHHVVKEHEGWAERLSQLPWERAQCHLCWPAGVTHLLTWGACTQSRSPSPASLLASRLLLGAFASG